MVFEYQWVSCGTNHCHKHQYRKCFHCHQVQVNVFGTRPFPEVKQQRRGVNHPAHLTPKLKKESSYTSTTPLRLHGMLQGELHLTANVTVVTCYFDASCFRRKTLNKSQEIFGSTLRIRTLRLQVTNNNSAILTDPKMVYFIIIIIIIIIIIFPLATCLLSLAHLLLNQQ